MEEVNRNKMYKQFRDIEMLLKLFNAIVDKRVSDEDYETLLKHFTEKEDYEYCERLKEIYEHST